MPHTRRPHLAAQIEQPPQSHVQGAGGDATDLQAVQVAAASPAPRLLQCAAAAAAGALRSRWRRVQQPQSRQRVRLLAQHQCVQGRVQAGPGLLQQVGTRPGR